MKDKKEYTIKEENIKKLLVFINKIESIEMAKEEDLKESDKNKNKK